MGELAEQERQFEGLPTWAALYFAAWGSTRPDGKAMSVEWAAGLAGVSPSAVRNWRMQDRAFRTLEYLARHGSAAFMASYVEAGLRGAAPVIVKAFLNLVEAGNAPVIIKGMEWLRGKPDEMDVTMRGAVAQARPNEWAGLDDDTLDHLIANLQAAVGRSPVGNAAADEPGQPGPAGLDDPETFYTSTWPAVQFGETSILGGDLQHSRTADGDLQGVADGSV